ncbi:hypothetical protein MXD62_33130 [Frankia sp. Mgl5]|uniref:hypothetical protein n=1 Tax=Frankia sp. Mgl5 TaxID=2933793 RepID=UPI00200F8D51|nr:hypothetical protein [Frankia sp. Mgl5]MCK9931924.1 hypothetical protein [Frankia sp. Mgl5]
MNDIGEKVTDAAQYGAQIFVGFQFPEQGVASAVGFFGHASGLAAYLVTATSGLPDAQQGLATGLVTIPSQP